MLQNLLDLVSQNAQQAIVQNPAIPDAQNNDAIQAVSQSIFNGLQQQVQAGNFQQLVSLLGGQQSLQNHPIVNNISQGAIGNLMQQFGLQDQQAQQIVSQVLPTVLQQLVQKTNNPQDSSFDLGGIVGALTGGQVPSELGGLVNQFIGGQGQQSGGLNNLIGGIGSLFGR